MTTSMKTIHATGVYGAIAIGNAYILEHKSKKILRKKIDDTAIELKRIKIAKEKALYQLSEVYKKALSDFDDAYAQIFEIHMMMLEDDDYNKAIEDIIGTESVNAEYAVLAASDSFYKMFSDLDDAYMRARAEDIKDVSSRLISCLLGSIPKNPKITDKIIVCADDLTPAEIVSLDKEKLLAFVTAFGSSNSHTAILARNMGIPACVNAGVNFLKSVSCGEKIIVDGHTGDIIISPDIETEAFYLKKQAEDEVKKAVLQHLKGTESVTKDGTRINIYANIDDINEISSALYNGADGIGLLRSEFLYLKGTDFPTEDTLFFAYKKALKNMAKKRVIIRALDIGADKQADYFGLKKEENPALGCRAIRLCLARPKILKTQLRALFRASVYGNLGIMFPMITTKAELLGIKNILEEVKLSLKKDGIRYSDNIEIGIMLETPAAALISDELAEMVDFFSIGTNDLTQYTLACDRQNPALAPFIDTHHKAILRLIEMSAKNAHKHGTRICICGELATDTTLTEAFIKMGIYDFSVPVPFILPLREKIRSL